MKRQQDVIKVLNELSKEELIRIIVKLAEQDDLFKNSLLVKYVQGKDGAQQLALLKKLMDAIVDKYTGEEGFIPYRDTHLFAQDMLNLLDEADSEMDSGSALEVVLMVLREGVASFQYADDSNGDIGMLVEECLERIRAIVSGLQDEDLSSQANIFERLLNVCNSDIFEGWDNFETDMLQICTEFACEQSFRQQLKEAIEQKIAVAAQMKYGDYTVEALLQLLFQLLKDYGSLEEVNKFMEEHLQYSSFRELAIEQALRGKDYRRVIQLAEEGEQQDQRLAGLMSKWQNYRYAAYKKLSLRNEQMQLAQELLLNGDYTYYQELESLAEGDKEDFYRAILIELKKSGNWRTRDVYLKLISDKDDRDEMLAYVRSNPSAIENYAARLSADYNEEVERIYSNYIYKAAGSSTNRKEYKQVCAMIKRYRKVFDSSGQSQIVGKLRNEHSKRPAFLDELSKV
ncbi:hypothetical protein H8B09_19500 [Paenibacillus sp. PR3]|uniref:Uncharacterized protein n=1 Tax=Paenibacillus terricola TaxID=2763503 RepID=A0ABR8N129_9BACL|nr:hypothetical protein [Paenibacillus terricola]MBD3920961.1 hypothetical protein [Paenibacillus terricola]